MTENDLLVERLARIPSERRSEFLRRLGLDATSSQATAEAQPLTDEQEQVWLGARLLGDTAPAWTVARYRISGSLRPELLASAIRDLYLETDVLHATFREADAVPGEVTAPDESFAVRTEDATAVAQEERERFLRSLVDELTAEPPYLERGPLVRARLVAFRPDEHVLLWAAHPLVFDTRSAHVLVDRLADAYAAAAAGEPVPAAGSYAEYRRWQREWRGSVEAEACLEDWQSVLDGAQLAELPYDRQPAQAAIRLSELRRPLPEEALAAVRAASDRLEAAPEAIVASAYAAMLSRHTSQTDLVVGLPHDVQVPSLDPNTLGVFGNLLPLRLDLSGRPSFDDLVRQTQAVLEGARARQRLSYKLLLDSVDVPRDPGGVPLVTTGVALAPPRRAREAAGVAFALEESPPRGTRFRLGLEVTLADGGEVVATWDGACFDERTVERLAARFELLLEDGCANGSRRVDGLRMIPRRELEQTVHEWNETAAPRPRATIVDLVAAATRERAGRTAVVAGGTTTTYAELDEASRRAAGRLAALGVKLEDRVGLALGRDANAIAAILGILSVGGAFVPVDCDQPPARVQTILADAGVSFVLTDDAHADRVPAGAWSAVRIESLLAPGEGPTSEAAPAIAPENAAYVLYTSGSTGKPKGVLIQHGSVANFAQTVRDMFDLTADDRIVHYAASTFDVSIFEIFAALTTGAELHVASEDERRSLDALTRLLAQHRITVCDLPPAIMELLDPEQFPDLRVAFVGGEAFTGELTTRWARGRRFFNGYGPTEATVTVVAKECSGEWSASPPIGRAMANHRAYVLNGELEPQPLGVVGDLYIAGDGLARGYVGAPAATAGAFLPDPFALEPDKRMYKTGDLAYWNDDGDLVFVGRNDRQIKLRGIRIELGEVEAALERHPQVKQAAVVPVTKDGAPETALVAYVVTRVGTPVDAAAMRDFLLGQIPEFMLPAHTVYVERLPLTASGKLDVAALPSPELDGDSSATEAAPRTATEERVANEIFAPLLGLESVNVDMNLFALGGSSLQAIQVLARVRSEFGVEVSIGEFFRSPTVAHVAAEIDRALAANSRVRADVTVSLVVEDDDAGIFDEFLEELRNALSRGGIDLDLETGRAFERRNGGLEIGRVVESEPGRRVRLEWRPGDWAPNEQTEVEISAEPTESGATRITVEQREWGALVVDGWGPIAEQTGAPRVATEVGGWFASEVAAPLLRATAPSRLGDWLTERWVARPAGARSRAAYGEASWQLPHFNLVLEALAPTPDDYLLEVGCGGGAFLREALASGCRAVAIDRSDEMVRVALERNRDAVLEERLEVLEADAARLPFPDETFTAAATIGVLPFLDDPAAVFREIHRVLRPGGRVVAFTTAPEIRGTIAAPEPIGSRLRLHTDEELERFATEAGFAEVRVERPEDRERHARAAGVPEEYLPLFKGRGAQLVLARRGPSA